MVARKQRRYAQGEALVSQRTCRKIDRDVEVESALVDLGGGGDSLFEDEVGELADAVVLLGRRDELRGGDGALFGVRPASQRFRADDALRRKIKLRLIGDP